MMAGRPVSVALAGLALEYYSPCAIGVAAGLLGVVTALAWARCDWGRRLPEPGTQRPA